MLKKFSDYAAALAYGKQFAEGFKCPVYKSCVYNDVGCTTLIAPPSSVHQISPHAQCDTFHGFSGWTYHAAGVMQYSEKGRALLAIPESDDFPAALEYEYNLLACHTTGYTPSELRELAREMRETKAGVWHVCNARYNREHPEKPVPCPCGKCRMARK